MQKGNSSILILIVVLVFLIIAASAGSYYILKSQGAAPAYITIEDANNYFEPTSITTSQTNSDGISQADDVATIEKELNSTSTGSIDADIKDLDTSASSL